MTSVLTLCPVTSQCGCPSIPASAVIPTMNPPMTYDSTLGTPSAQNIIPPYPQLPAHIDELNGISSSYVWNPTKGQWL